MTARGGAAKTMFESIAAWMIVGLFVLGVWLMASATWGSAARASEIQIPRVEQGQGIMPGRSRAGGAGQERR
jgi:hypothetical protein